MKKVFGPDCPITIEKEWDNVFEKQCKTVAKTLKISIHDARTRMAALQESNLFEHLAKNEIDFRKGVDLFLANPNWASNPERVLISTKRELAFNAIFAVCLEEKEFVTNFDRLAGTNIWSMIKTGAADINEKAFNKQMNKFSKFVRQTVLYRLPDEAFK